MIKHFGLAVLQTALLLSVAVVESVVGIPFVFFLLASLFLQGREVWWQAPFAVLWSVVAAVLFSVPVVGVLAIISAGIVFLELGTPILENRTGRVVLVAFVGVGVVLWFGGIIWSMPVIVYSLVSVLLGTLLTYRSAVFQTRRQLKYLWSSEVAR